MAKTKTTSDNSNKSARSNSRVSKKLAANSVKDEADDVTCQRLKRTSRKASPCSQRTNVLALPDSQQELKEVRCSVADGILIDGHIRFQRRKKIRPNESFEERAQRLIRQRLLRQLKETPEQRQERLTKAKLARLNETLEQRRERLNKKKMYRLAETAEERQQRLANEKITRMRMAEEKRQEYRMKKKLKRMSETPDERAERLLQEKWQRLNESPEKREERLLKARLARLNETAEEREERLRKKRMYRLAETDEQRTARLMKERNLRMSRAAELNRMKKLRRQLETSEQRKARLFKGMVMRLNETTEKREERLLRARFIRLNETGQQRQERLEKKKMAYVTESSGGRLGVKRLPHAANNDDDAVVHLPAFEHSINKLIDDCLVAEANEKQSDEDVGNETKRRIVMDTEPNEITSTGSVSSTDNDNQQYVLHLECSEESVEEYGQTLSTPSDDELFSSVDETAHTNSAHDRTAAIVVVDDTSSLSKLAKIQNKPRNKKTSAVIADRTDVSNSHAVTPHSHSAQHAELRLVLPTSDNGLTELSIGNVEIVGFVVRTSSRAGTEYVCTRCLTPERATLVKRRGAESGTCDI